MKGLFTKKGDISIQYVAAIVMVLALLVVILIYTGVLRIGMEDMVKKFIDFIIG